MVVTFRIYVIIFDYLLLFSAPLLKCLKSLSADAQALQGQEGKICRCHKITKFSLLKNTISQVQFQVCIREYPVCANGSSWMAV